MKKVFLILFSSFSFFAAGLISADAQISQSQPKYLKKRAADPTSCTSLGAYYYNTVSNAYVYCSVVGTPGTWVTWGGGGGAVSSVAGKTGAVSLAVADTAGLQTALDGKVSDTTVISPQAGSYTVTIADSGKFFTATDTTDFTLPASASATAGKTRFYFFHNALSSRMLNIVAVGTDRISGYSTTTTAEIFVPAVTATTQGSSVELLYIGSGRWAMLSTSGDWQ